MKKLLIATGLLALTSSPAIAELWTTEHTKALNNQWVQEQGKQISKDVTIESINASVYSQKMTIIYRYTTNYVTMDSDILQVEIDSVSKSLCNTFSRLLNRMSNLKSLKIQHQYYLTDYTVTKVSHTCK